MSLQYLGNLPFELTLGKLRPCMSPSDLFEVIRSLCKSAADFSRDEAKESLRST